ncbi:MAG: hypothetical protein VYC62_05185 [Verrucomicrobiota bacterium]|jgi:hypothetical protein|nr:hypothetical protein [Verrucomicrobiota bacterium]
MKSHRKFLTFLIGFIAGDFVHAYIMDLQNSGDFFSMEGLMILLVAGPATSPEICFTIMFTCGGFAVFLKLLLNKLFHPEQVIHSNNDA